MPEKEQPQNLTERMDDIAVFSIQVWAKVNELVNVINSLNKRIEELERKNN